MLISYQFSVQILNRRLKNKIEIEKMNIIKYFTLAVTSF